MQLLSGSEAISFIQENYGSTEISSNSSGISKLLFEALFSSDVVLLLPSKKSLYWSLGHIQQNNHHSELPEYFAIPPNSLNNAIISPFYNSDCSITLSIAIPITSEYFNNINRLSIVKALGSTIVCISPYRNVGKISEPPRYLVGMAHVVPGRGITIEPHGVLLYSRTGKVFNPKPNITRQEIEYPMPCLPIRPWDTAVAISTKESDISFILTHSFWTISRYYLSLHAYNLAIAVEVAFRGGGGRNQAQSLQQKYKQPSERASQSPHERAAHIRRLADGRVIKVSKSKVNYK